MKENYKSVRLIKENWSSIMSIYLIMEKTFPFETELFQCVLTQPTATKFLLTSFIIITIKSTYPLPIQYLNNILNHQ